MHAIAKAILSCDLIQRTGRVVAVRGAIVEAIGPTAQVGELCSIRLSNGNAEIDAEVIGFSDGRTVMMPWGTVSGIELGAEVVAKGQLPKVPVGRALLGRVVDAVGRPIDDKGALDTSIRRSVFGTPPSPLQRARVDQPIETGVKVIDTMLTLAKGQRVGLFAGSGVGKSSLMGSVAQGTRLGINVIALIGERSREVREFVEDQLGPQALQRSVVVVATSGEPAVLRMRAAHAATTIAEYFRDQGEDVLLLMDSLTRFAMARREVGLAVGEPPTARGYTPSVFAELPLLCERCGTGAQAGSITGIYTVLVDGDDLNEPVSDAVRGILDGHVVLSRDLANSGQFPAVDVLQSISRLHTAVAATEDLAAARRVLSHLAIFERNRQLIEIGAYKRGVSPVLDEAVDAVPGIQRFLKQAQGERVSRVEALKHLRLVSAAKGSV